MSRLERIVTWLVLIAAIGAVILLTTGCSSAVREISRSANTIVDEANATKADLAKADAAMEGESARPFVRQASRRQDAIIRAANQVSESVTQTQDRENWLERLLGQILWIALAVAAVIAAVILYGVARRKGWILPKKVRQEADLHAKVLAGRITPDHLTTQWRTEHPGHDRAFRKAHREVSVHPSAPKGQGETLCGPSSQLSPSEQPTCSEESSSAA